MKRHVLVAALIGTLQPSAVVADEHGGTWVSEPRAEITIVVAEDGGRISGPGWEHRFDAGANSLDFEIEPGRRFLLRWKGDAWVGEYFHPRIRPGPHEPEPHIMIFSRKPEAR